MGWDQMRWDGDGMEMEMGLGCMAGVKARVRSWSELSRFTQSAGERQIYRDKYTQREKYTETNTHTQT